MNHNDHRALFKALACVAVLGGLSSTTGSARGAASVHGTICQEDDADSGYNLNAEVGVENTNPADDIQVNCPIPIDHDLGTGHSFQARVFDGSPNDQVSCLGFVMDTLGNEVCATSSAPSGTNDAFVGEATLSFSCTSSITSAAFSYAVRCTLPADDGDDPSAIFILRAI